MEQQHATYVPPPPTTIVLVFYLERGFVACMYLCMGAVYLSFSHYTKYKHSQLQQQHLDLAPDQRSF
jgi:hypothetical protein